ncbi:MAG: hypothetical protein IKZ38_04795 [Clostridia bacterium]|nr:hypothetical protein [Clostridia bacterium]
MKSFTKIKNYILIVFLAISCGCFAFLLTSNAPKAYAETPSTLQFPSSNCEIFDFEGYTPKDAVAFDGGYAIIREDKTLWIYSNGAYSKYDELVYNNPSLMRATNDGRLIVSDDTCLFAIDLSDLSASPVMLTYNGSPILCKYFDINERYLITISSHVVNAYAYNKNLLNFVCEITSSADDLTPVGIDDNDSVYLVSNGKLQCYTKNANAYKLENANKDIPLTSKPSVLATCGDAVYFTEGSLVKKVASDKTISALNSPQEQDFDLGNVKAPTTISFYQDKALICDAEIGAVQQFEIDGDQLVYTGFAISKGKTAFNRISEKDIDIERYSSYIAVLGENRIMLTNANENFDYFDRNCYSHLFARDFDGVMPTMITLGKGALISAVEDGFYLYDFSSIKPVLSTKISCDGTITDTTYQNGYFYVLANFSDSTSRVFKFTLDDFKKDDFNLNDFRVGASEYARTTPHRFAIGVNVFGKIITHDQSVKKITSDLVGNFYLLKDNGIYTQASGSVANALVKTVSGATSITLSFDKKDCLILDADKERSYAIDDLTNKAIDDILVPQTFKTTGNSAPNELSACTAKNTNLYLVNAGAETFEFIDLAKSEQHYLVLDSILSLNLDVLVCQQGVVLANKGGLTKTTLEQVNISSTAYVATDVNGYFLPVITPEDTYALQSANGNAVRLSKGDTISTYKTVKFLGIEYYYANFVGNGVSVFGYVPVNFTTLQPISVTPFTEFTYEKLKTTKVYLDSGFLLQIGTLEKGETVRVLSKENGVVKIQFLNSGFWITGYIEEDAIIQPTKSIRNVIIVLATLTCTFGTTTFLLLKKKND